MSTFDRKAVSPHKQSAGLLLYRRASAGIEVLVVHPGGPYFAKKDKGAWSIPKGEPEESELTDSGAYDTARREFTEELGQSPPGGEAIDLGDVRQKGGKVVRAFGLLCDDCGIDTGAITSNDVVIEWPRGSGRLLTFPEVDKAQWMSPEVAREKLVPAQVTLLERLLALVES
jgi:predicted NUDIX family NTP pyrophosphohydrolase